MLNRANSKVGMKKKEVEGALDVKIRFEVPSDRAVPLGVNRACRPQSATRARTSPRDAVLGSWSPRSSPKKARRFAVLSEGVTTLGLHDRISKQNGNGAAAQPPSVRPRLPAPLSPSPRLIPGRGTLCRPEAASTTP